MKRIAFFASFVGALFLLAGVTYFFISPGTKASAVITGVSATNIMWPGAQIIWSTDIPSDSRVAYGTNQTLLTLFSDNRCDAGGLTTTHCVNLTGLAANTVYYYKVESRDSGNADSQLGGFNFTSASYSGSDTTAPSTPTGLTATAVSVSQINLAWTASTDNVGVVGYKVYRNETQVGDVTAPNYSDTGLAQGTSYSYTVLAYDAAGNQSPQSSSASATTETAADVTAPNTPTGLSATAISTSQINLAWTASTDNVAVIGYKIYKNGTYVGSVTSGTAYSSTGLSAGTSYSYTVAAFDSAGNLSGQSATASASTQTSADTTAPNIPTGLSATAISSTGINLTWTASTDNVGVVGYKIYRGGTQIGTVTTPNYSDTGLAQGTSYSYTVLAYDAAGNQSPQSSSASASTQTSSDVTAPATPTALIATAISTSQINLSWTASTDNVAVTGYKIYQNGTYFTSVTSGTAYSSTGLSAGTSYSYAVLAFDAGGNFSGLSSSVSAVTLSSGGTGTTNTTSTTDTTAPVISNVRTENSISSGAQVKWSTDDASDSLVQFGTISGSSASNSSWRCDDGGDVTVHCINLTGLVSGATYYYKVISKNASGLETKSVEKSFVAGSSTTTSTTTASVNSTFAPVTFAVNVGTPWCKDSRTIAPVSFKIDPSGAGYFSVDGQKISSANMEFFAGTHTWNGIPLSGYAVSGKGEGTFAIPNIDSCSVAITTTDTQISTQQTNSRAYIALWQGDINVLSGQTVQGELRINVGVENSESVSIYLKKKDATEPALLGQAIRATDRPSLWRFVWDSKTIPDGDIELFSRIKNGAGEYAGDVVYVRVKNTVDGSINTSTAAETSSIVNELFAHPENLEIAKAFLSEKIENFLETSSVEEKQRAAEKIRKDLALDILVSNTGSVEVQVGTTLLSRKEEPERILEEITKAVKNREGASVLEDTDKDTISDYDETYLYNTDPKKADSDGDGVNDGEEILLGMNPLKNEVALVSYEDPKEVVVAAKADPKEFTVDKIALIPAATTENGSITKEKIALEGTALPNSFVMIYIFSTPVVVTVKTDSDGKWKYTMDKELEDGNHEIYVAMTESAGKIIVKSDPIPFVKTAQAVTLSSDFALANTAVESQTGFFRGGTLVISLIVLFVLLGISFMAISFFSKKRELSDEQNPK